MIGADQISHLVIIIAIGIGETRHLLDALDMAEDIGDRPAQLLPLLRLRQLGELGM